MCLETLSPLHDLKKLRALCYIYLQYSEHLEVTSLFMSQVFLQYYQSSNESKILTNYQEMSDYEIKQFHKQASNCVVSALNFALIDDPTNTRRVWSNLSTC
mmetsp:Transcript_39936/g.52249  ORF Transcript_39936/g.52249 Transcript_39936/m.52249 type:complete len:101 (+) Transcript_39936:1142-1444(+)|eukprot:CAMPEP_0185588646 /NCGR_PEP_ID=MMETSP0434-20130131/53935_1 /TAXON_ID=626734 ORGANISM="Favella taraikaensis, Strain Fe Narragansett Bay" /NCGR_SAMPLE_ID=MMETSP0434 /ASSEMBLY_ACC=CAM_ASM_000379 /LENGTH=100 /DNA_ID=CAMNT_0028211485 /DNA_START=1124 /DNA_END=1426 /DNA_ORIENTATION=-